MASAEEFQQATKSRGEELNALATAKKIIKESTGGAAGQSYGLNQVSFLQVERAQVASGADLAKFEAVRFVRDLARKSKAPALAQLASRMASAMRLGAAAGEDPFAKVKGLINDMIATLESEAEEDASQKAYCDKAKADADKLRAEEKATFEKNSAEMKLGIEGVKK